MPITPAATAATETGPRPGADLADPVVSAESAGLRYVDDSWPGIRRRRVGKGFSYTGPDGAAIRDADTLRRIRALAIPPAWREVWICPSAEGHIQATGRDAKRRKQYRYHPRWHEVRDSVKYDRMVAFGEALPGIRERVDRDLARRGMPREKALALVVRLLDQTSIRVGNDEYRKRNRSFGLTTLRARQAAVEGASVRFEFRGKGGKQHSVAVRDRRLARLVRQCQELPGQELFQYLDEDGTRVAVSSADVNAYLDEITGEHFTAKDFRTWNGTVLAAAFLAECDPCTSEAQGRRQVAAMVREVAPRLGNTPAVCRKAYIHPRVIERYLAAPPDGEGPAMPCATGADSRAWLSDSEQVLLSFLKLGAEVAAGRGLHTAAQPAGATSRRPAGRRRPA